MSVSTMKTLIPIFLLFATVHCQRQPTIVFITPDQIKEIGGTVELSCSVQYVEQFSILWKKISNSGTTADATLISSGTTPIIRDSRFSLRYDTASTTYTLQIKDIQNSDAGIYKCQILMSANHQVSKEVKLQVFSAPYFYDNSSSSLSVLEHSSTELHCYAGGTPTPQISWKRENNALLPTGNTVYKGNILKINSIRKEDRGTYYCAADNKVGKNVKRSVLLEVEFKPMVTATKAQIGQAVNFDADLECRIEAYPKPQIAWSKDGNHLTNTVHHKILNFPGIGEFTDTTLRVISTERKQYGIYVCKAVNKLGEGMATVEFYETENAVCPPACGPGNYGSGNLFLPNNFILLTFVIFLFSR